MGAFLARRVGFALLLALAVSSAALLLARAAPGDVTGGLGPSATRAEIADVRARFDLDRDPLSQLALWLSRAARLDFGTSFLYERPVSELVVRAAANTAVLGILALILATCVGVPLGIFTGTRRGGLVPSLVRGASLVCLSLPPILTSLLLVWVAARTGWLPTGGMTGAALVEQHWIAWLLDVARHLPLPALALALPAAAMLERLQSQAIATAVREPFVRAAAARGAAARTLILRHAWRASLRSLLGTYGLLIGALLSGSFVVEFITAWPGLGRLMFEALRARDIYLVAGCAAAGAAFLAAGTLAADLLLAYADPRVRQEDGR